MYAIVRAGGRQEKVEVNDTLVVDRVPGPVGSTLQLPALLLVDGQQVTSDPAALAGVTVTAEVLDETKGKKIKIRKYRNKTGYRKRMGYRSKLTRLLVTGIDVPAGSSSASVPPAEPVDTRA